MNHGDKTPSQYIIKKTDGCNYMFHEWKSGDYIIGGMNLILLCIKIS